MNEEYLDKKVMVCDKCLTASCWHGEFMCDQAYEAGLIPKTRRELIELDREHPSNFSDETLKKINGG